MRFTTTFFTIVGALALFLYTQEPSEMLLVLVVSVGMMSLLWGLLVLANGGPRKFCAIEKQWREPDLAPYLSWFHLLLLPPTKSSQRIAHSRVGMYALSKVAPGLLLC